MSKEKLFTDYNELFDSLDEDLYRLSIPNYSGKKIPEQNNSIHNSIDLDSEVKKLPALSSSSIIEKSNNELQEEVYESHSKDFHKNQHVVPSAGIANKTTKTKQKHNEMAKFTASMQAFMLQMREDHENKITKIHEDHENKITKIHEDHENKITKIHEDHKKEMKKIHEDHNNNITKLQTENNKLQTKVESAKVAYNHLSKELDQKSRENTHLRKENIHLTNRNAQLETEEFTKVINALKKIIPAVMEYTWNGTSVGHSSIPEGINKIRSIITEKNYNDSWLNPQNNSKYNIERVIDLAIRIHDVSKNKAYSPHLSSYIFRGEKQKEFYQEIHTALTKALENYITPETKKVETKNNNKTEKVNTQNNINTNHDSSSDVNFPLFFSSSLK